MTTNQIKSTKTDTATSSKSTSTSQLLVKIPNFPNLFRQSINRRYYGK